MRNYFLAFMLFVITPTTFAQITFSRISFEFGIVSNYQSSFVTSKLLSFSPEIKLGGKFIEDYFEWDFNISYWEDGVNKPFQIQDGYTFSYSSTSLGIRLNYFPMEVNIPIHLISGLSTRFVNKKYIGGFDLGGNIGKNSSFILYTLDFGAGLNFIIAKDFRLRCDFLLFMPLKENDSLFEKGWSGSAKLGIDYYF